MRSLRADEISSADSFPLLGNKLLGADTYDDNDLPIRIIYACFSDRDLQGSPGFLYLSQRPA